MHTHITRDDRAVIANDLRAGESYRYIAGKLGKDVSAVWQEVKRNKDEDGVYRAVHAQRKADLRRLNSKQRYRKIENDPKLKRSIEKRLHPLVSPEVIAHDLPVSHEAIYTFVYRSRPDLKKNLPQRGRKRRRYGSKRALKQGWTRDVRGIGERPAGATNRSRNGHLEGDTVRGVNGALLTHTDRKSRFEIVDKVSNEGADEAYVKVINSPYFKHAHSITYDRGSTFALWKMIEKKIGIKVYFADPHAPWQRGTNENSNGRLRRMYPKGFDFATVTQEDIDQTVWIMNHTKRKCLNWRTPCNVYGRCCVSE